MERYRIVSPGGAVKELSFSAGASLRQAYTRVADELKCAVKDVSIVVRDPGSMLPRQLLLSDAPLSTALAPGGVLLVESNSEAADECKPSEAPVRASSPIGMSNFGNTCYMNSALQCLYHTQVLTSQLFSTDASGLVVDAFLAVMRRLWSNTEAFAPRELKEALEERTGHFRGYAQQDAQEYIAILLDSLHEDLRRERVAPMLVDGDDLWQKARATDASIVSDIFQGQLRSKVRCSTCGAEEETFQLFWSLPLSLPVRPPGSELMLADLLDEFCAEEDLGESWICPQCKQAVQATKQMELWRVPAVLQVHLKRFEWQMPVLGGAAKLRGHFEQSKETWSTARQCEPDSKNVRDKSELSAFEEAAALPWEVQEKMYSLLLQILSKICEAPQTLKFRSVSKSSVRLRGDLLDSDAGVSLLEWAGFQDVGERLVLASPVAEVEETRKKLQVHAEAMHMRYLRRVRDERIQEERRRRLPTGESQPIHRWGGRLPSFGGRRSTACKKLRRRVLVGEAFCLDRWLAADAPGPRGGRHELFGVVEHLGDTPFSGHYVANCRDRKSVV